jgi:hypothetical protein
MARRDPFADLKSSQAEEAYNQLDLPGKLRQPLDYIPVAQAMPRSRRWEKTHKAHAFRRVPPNVQQAVRQAAYNESLTVDSVAQAFLEFALMCYERGDLPLDAQLIERGQTLLPEHGWGGHSRARWLEKTWGLTPPRKKPLKVTPTKVERPWKDWKVVAYRLSDAVFAQVDRLRREKYVPSGEVLTRLLMHALNAYEIGQMAFLAGEGENLGSAMRDEK